MTEPQYPNCLRAKAKDIDNLAELFKCYFQRKNDSELQCQYRLRSEAEDDW